MFDPVFAVQQFLRDLPGLLPGLLRDWKAAAGAPADHLLLLGVTAWAGYMAAAMFRHGLDFRLHAALGLLLPVWLVAGLATGRSSVTLLALLAAVPCLHLAGRRCPECRQGFVNLSVHADEGGMRRNIACAACDYGESVKLS